MTKKTSKVFTGLAIFSLAATALAGCGSSADNKNTNTAGSSDAPKEQTVTWLSARPENGAIVQTIRELADRFAADHPGFKLDLQVTADRPSYLTKLRTLVASGQMPDFIDSDADPFAQELVNAGLLVDMEKFLKDEGLYDKFYEPALKYQELPDGSLYLLPMEYHMEMTWYNKKYLQITTLLCPKP